MRRVALLDMLGGDVKTGEEEVCVGSRVCVKLLPRSKRGVEGRWGFGCLPVIIFRLGLG